MANTSCSLNIHCIFSTKERAPMLNPEPRERLWPFLGGMAKQNGITPRCIGGVAGYLHLLLSLPTLPTSLHRHPGTSCLATISRKRPANRIYQN